MKELIFNSENKLRSDKSSLAYVEPVLENLRQMLGIKDENFYNIMIAVTEAVNNAISHGNKLNPQKKVDFIVQADFDSIYVKVTDEGTGFDPDNIADCLEPENLLKSSGRGIFIIRELMDDVKIISNESGTSIEMFYGYRAK